MKKICFLVFATSILMACGPSQAEFNDLQGQNAALQQQVDSLNKELTAYKCSPEKLLATAKEANQKNDLKNLGEILAQAKEYHPETKECAEIKALYDQAKERAEAKKREEQARKEKEKQERLAVVNKMKKEVDDVAGITWYYNSYFTHYNNSNHISLYIGKNSTSVWLRLMMSYTGDNWIFFDNAYLSYDGKTREIAFDKYQNKKTENEGGYVWEWIDVPVSAEDLAYLKKYAESDSPKMRLSGKYEKTRTLTKAEINALKEVITGYEVLKKEK